MHVTYARRTEMTIEKAIKDCSAAEGDGVTFGTDIL